MDPTLKVAQTSPKTMFYHATGYKNAPNMGTYEARTYESACLAGVMAGKMTKSNTLGFVASVKIPEVIRNINATPWARAAWNNGENQSRVHRLMV